jgi:hypothetical protein
MSEFMIAYRNVLVIVLWGTVIARIIFLALKDKEPK